MVLVGDPQQLPATVMSQMAASMQLDRSLMERLQKAECATKVLRVQYRMHPSIRQFPSDFFYNNLYVNEAMSKYRVEIVAPLYDDCLLTGCWMPQRSSTHPMSHFTSTRC